MPTPWKKTSGRLNGSKYDLGAVPFCHASSLAFRCYTVYARPANLRTENMPETTRLATLATVTMDFPSFHYATTGAGTGACNGCGGGMAMATPSGMSSLGLLLACSVSVRLKPSQSRAM